MARMLIWDAGSPHSRIMLMAAIAVFPVAMSGSSTNSLSTVNVAGSLEKYSTALRLTFSLQTCQGR